ncbi:MAG TPA: DivIVA domain-containing protein [Candidatus Hydrothermia bacterium]|nr:DivIVA domain-containing protein [Candidatus Hydrothermae bacterium]MDD3649204.1 DivIVA domain-containing protein [Candidatus Hydrothermia bacterium]MDD5572408.1 DivIVA domain-containing protein [Candidatus Hydrothermia bacterium]HOK22619.1 DivIVA domain-containing protein [Candidatus Hydrothermia bacterium]HOL23328.1 DivIVA domain-containing protein [Candidatus Hydrothermia bacterium]
MRLTPLEIRKATFKTRFRGFDPEEVLTYLELVSNEFEKIIQENERLKERIMVMEKRLAEYQELEESLKKALFLAQQASEQAVTNAQEKAQSIIGEAQLKGERMLAEATLKKAKLEEEVQRLERRKYEILQKLRGELEFYLRTLSREVKEIE